MPEIGLSGLEGGVRLIPHPYPYPLLPDPSGTQYPDDGNAANIHTHN